MVDVPTLLLVGVLAMSDNGVLDYFEAEQDIKPFDNSLVMKMAEVDREVNKPTPFDIQAIKPVQAPQKQASLPFDMGAIRKVNSTLNTPPVATTAPAQASNKFYLDIGKFAEDDHGSTPQVTNDSREAQLAQGKKSKDIGFGHKVTAEEEAAGTIHGVTFKDSQGNYIDISDDDKVSILQNDMESHKNTAAKIWDRKLADGKGSLAGHKGKSFADIDPRYQQALTSLAYNVGGSKAGNDWTRVLKGALDGDVVEFAKDLRRRDGGKNTAGMDNRVVKELFYAGLIKNISEVRHVLPLADKRSGVPE